MKVKYAEIFKNQEEELLVVLFGKMVLLFESGFWLDKRSMSRPYWMQATASRDSIGLLLPQSNPTYLPCC